MTKKVALFVDNGGEELELIAPLDIMRRANLEVDLISANNAEYVIGAHNIKIIVDKKINDIEDILEYDAIVIPGGMPGSTLLRDNKKIIEFFDKELECQSFNSKKAVVVDKNVITAQGPAVAILFGYEIVNYLLKDETANTVKEQMLLPVLKNNI